MGISVMSAEMLSVATVIAIRSVIILPSLCLLLFQFFLSLMHTTQPLITAMCGLLVVSLLFNAYMVL